MNPFADATVLTGLALWAQAVWLDRRLGRPRRGWHVVLPFLTWAAAAGTLKHATTTGALHEAARLVSNLSLGSGLTLVALLGGSRARPPNGRRGAALAAGFSAFVAATALWPSFRVVVGYLTVVGCLVILDEVAAAGRGHAGAVHILVGLTIAAAAAAAWKLPLDLDPWLAGVDVAHLILLGTLALLASGHRASRGGS